MSGLVSSPDYIRKVIPYMEREYFPDVGDQIVFSLIKDHFLKYGRPPTIESVSIDLERRTLKESFYNKAKEVISELDDQKEIDVDWLSDATEDWCKRRAFFNAVLGASDLLDKDDTTLYNSAQEKMQQALAVGFDSNLGSAYIEDAEDRFKRYKEKPDKLLCGFDGFDEATKGGFRNETMTVLMASTGIGKSMFLCNFAANFMLRGKNVIYITLEMSEDAVNKRIDCNLLDLTEDQLESAEFEDLVTLMSNLKLKNIGKLKVKNYPSGSAHAGHFRHYIQELRLKEGFIPDIIIVDYLNICASSTMKKSSGLYEHDGAIAVEIRALAQEFHCRLFTATQVNREGSKNNDFDLTDTSNSWGVPHASDYFYGIVTTDILTEHGKMIVKRLKDRYRAIEEMPQFEIGVDKSKQRIYNVNGNNTTPDEMPVFEIGDIMRQVTMNAFIS